MHEFSDAHARDTEIDADGFNHHDHSAAQDRRGHPDRRKRDRRNTEDRKRTTDGLLQPILTQAEIAALLRGAR
jgi:hypothetical protein